MKSKEIEEKKREEKKKKFTNVQLLLFCAHVFDHQEENNVTLSMPS
jgi:hypothetical protein